MSDTFLCPNCQSMTLISDFENHYWNMCTEESIIHQCQIGSCMQFFLTNKALQKHGREEHSDTNFFEEAYVVVNEQVANALYQEILDTPNETRSGHFQPEDDIVGSITDDAILQEYNLPQSSMETNNSDFEKELGFPAATQVDHFGSLTRIKSKNKDTHYSHTAEDFQNPKEIIPKKSNRLKKPTKFYCDLQDSNNTNSQKAKPSKNLKTENVQNLPEDKISDELQTSSNTKLPIQNSEDVQNGVQVTCRNCRRKICYSSLNEHIQTCIKNEDMNQFPCGYKDCKATFSSKFLRKRHRRFFHKKADYRSTENKFSCLNEKCGAIFATRQYLHDHIKNVHQPAVKCPYQNCNRFVKPAGLNKHFKNCHEKIKKCMNCKDWIRIDDFQGHRKNCEKSKKKFSCPFDGCTAYFTSKTQRQQHLNVSHLSRVKCNHKGCGIFVNPQNLPVHFNAVHVQKQCPNCDEWMEIQHFCTHSKKCVRCVRKNCNRYFASKCNMIRHMKEVHKILLSKQECQNLSILHEE